MRLEIKFENKINPVIYEEYSRFIYCRMVKLLKRLVRQNSKRYKVRVPQVLQCSLIRWKGSPPDSINLTYYVENCLELVREKGVYVIRLNESWLVKGSRTRVHTLVRILEYGTLKIPALPVVRRVFQYYSKNYQNLFSEFMEERVFKL